MLDDTVSQEGREREDGQAGRAHNLESEREELTQATEQFVRSLVRAGMGVAFLPINMLPVETREHFKAAGREFTRGMATMVREFAASVEKLAEEPKKD